MTASQIKDLIRERIHTQKALLGDLSNHSMRNDRVMRDSFDKDIDKQQFLLIALIELLEEAENLGDYRHKTFIERE